MLRTRLWTAAILACVLFATVSFSDSLILKVIFFSLFAGMAAIEFMALRFRTIEGPGSLIVPRPRITAEHMVIGMLHGLTIGALALGDHFGTTQRESGLAFAFVWAIFCSVALSAWFYVTERNLAQATSKLINSMAGFVYIAFPGITLYRMSLVEIPDAPVGIGLYFCLAVVLMGDSMAYFGGRLFGKRPLLPRISPKKTLEGSAFGLMGSGLTGVGIAYYFNFPAPLVLIFIVSVTAGLAGQIGDLFESALKRVANVKDSNGIFPGHGGALDRIDAVLFGAPLCNLVFYFQDIFLR